MAEIEKKDESESTGTIDTGTTDINPETQESTSGSEIENPSESEYDSSTKITYEGKTSKSEFWRDGKRALDSGLFYPKDDVEE